MDCVTRYHSIWVDKWILFTVKIQLHLIVPKFNYRVDNIEAIMLTSASRLFSFVLSLIGATEQRKKVFVRSSTFGCKQTRITSCQPLTVLPQSFAWGHQVLYQMILGWATCYQSIWVDKWILFIVGKFKFILLYQNLITS